MTRIIGGAALCFGGKTCVKGFQQIEAKRIGPARSLPALAPARK